MLNLSNYQRSRRQQVDIILRRTFTNESETREKIWKIVLDLEKDNNFDHPLTRKILNVGHYDVRISYLQTNINIHFRISKNIYLKF